MIDIHSFAATDRGTVRDHNEDCYVDLPTKGLWVVADGAGGHAAGEFASAMLGEALSAVPPSLTPDETLAHIRLAVLAVNTALQAEAGRRGAGMIASTIVVLLIRDQYFATLWAGDSRAYLLRDGVLTQVTHDHSLVQGLVDAGAITLAEAEHHPQANVVTRAIGAQDDSGELDKVIGSVRGGDCFLLCTDGLTKAIDDGALVPLLHAPDPAAALVAAALARGVRDNVTAVVVQAITAGKT
jgi:protein phosphatase/serine/threonine-protein phosphatase Stp1